MREKCGQVGLHLKGNLSLRFQLLPELLQQFMVPGVNSCLRPIPQP